MNYITIVFTSMDRMDKMAFKSPACDWYDKYSLTRGVDVFCFTRDIRLPYLTIQSITGFTANNQNLATVSSIHIETI